MKIEDYIEPLDDYTGALAQEVAKLRMEAARGTLGKDEQVDLVMDLRDAVCRKQIRPWRSRCFAALVVGITFLAALAFLPSDLPDRPPLAFAGWSLALVSLFLAGYAGTVFLTRRKRALAWLRQMQGVIERGGSIFSLN